MKLLVNVRDAGLKILDLCLGDLVLLVLGELPFDRMELDLELKFGALELVDLLRE